MKNSDKSQTEANTKTRHINYSREYSLPLFYLKHFEEGLTKRSWQKVSEAPPRVIDTHEVRDRDTGKDITNLHEIYVYHGEIEHVHLFDQAHGTWHIDGCTVQAGYSPWQEQKSYVRGRLKPEEYLVSHANFEITGKTNSIRRVVRSLDDTIKGLAEVRSMR